jgi:hypothetical protein
VKAGDGAFPSDHDRIISLDPCNKAEQRRILHEGKIRAAVGDVMTRVARSRERHPMLSALLPVLGLLGRQWLPKTGAASHLLYYAYDALLCP